ncbi:MAG: transcriptional repressor LexA [Pseudomonadota bacterium]|nr:transcriptional repressor LexA [Pseudomonadota bacterium]
MLTRKQYQLLVFINGSLKKNGIPPSFEEMKSALDLKSKSGIHRLITGLEERGFIKRLPHRARALEILKLPDNLNHTNITKLRSHTTDNESNGKRSVTASNDTIELPLYGKIAAGTPVEALRDPSNTTNVPASMLGRGEHYTLEVEGDSMIEAGIFDGDTVIIERCSTAESGAIVVALVDENEVTLKRLRKNRGSVALEPANSKFETRIFGPGRIQIQGRLTGLLRKYLN